MLQPTYDVIGHWKRLVVFIADYGLHFPLD